MRLKMDITDLEDRTRKIENLEMRNSVLTYLDHHKVLIENVPASLKDHYAYTGGLLYHTCEVHDLCINIILMLKGTPKPKEFKYLDPSKLSIDNLRASAILHDLGNIFVFGETADGRWLYKSRKKPPDHSALVLADFGEITRYALPRDVCLSILAHEGGWSRSGVYPNTIGSTILSNADSLSRHLNSFEWNL
jgi:hypothetical protein